MGNLADDLSFEGLNRRRIKEAWSDLASELRFTHFFTLVWNRGVSRPRAKSDLRAFHGRVDQRLFGRQLHRIPRDRRSLAVFTFETGITVGTHVHGLWGVPGPEKLLRFSQLWPTNGHGEWSKIVPGGTYDFRVIDSHDEAVGYMMKRQFASSDDADMVWSDEFLPGK